MTMMQADPAPRRGAFLRGGVDKVERYDWIPLGKIGEFAWLDKRLLLVDSGPHGYQREAHDAKALDIARDFRWPAFGVLLVARTLDATYFVFDGGHRLNAAMRRSDVKTVPCMIFDLASRAEQARMFSWANTRRRGVDAHEKHRAAVAGEDAVAIAVEQLISSLGYRTSKSDATYVIRCIAAVRRCFVNDEAATRDTLALAVQVAQGRIITDTLFQGLWYLWRATDGGIGERAERARVLKIGMDALVGGARKAQAAFIKGGARVWAQGMADVINRGRPERNHIFLGRPANIEATDGQSTQGKD